MAMSNAKRVRDHNEPTDTLQLSSCILFQVIAFGFIACKTQLVTVDKVSDQLMSIVGARTRNNPQTLVETKTELKRE